MGLETPLTQSSTNVRALPQIHSLASSTRENTIHRWAAVPLTGCREKLQGQRVVKLFSLIKNWEFQPFFAKLGKFLLFGCVEFFIYFPVPEGIFGLASSESKNKQQPQSNYQEGRLSKRCIFLP